MSRIISWFSCGAASAVATKLAIASGKQITIAYCEVKEEHPDNKRFLNDCQEWFGQEITVLRNEFYDASIYRVFENNYMRTPHGSPCTRALKKQVRRKFEKPEDLQVFGYTIEEKHRLERLQKEIDMVNLWPILIEKELTKDDCLAMVANAGIELPEMYKLGYRNNNCIGCVKGGMGYWNKIRVDFPAEFERMKQLEIKNECTVLKDSSTSEPIYLRDLDPAAGNYPKEPDISCGLFCQIAEMDYAD